MITGKCPICSGELHINSLRCTECDATITGDFKFIKLALLDKSQISFIESFLKCRGNMKEMEKEVGMSYPTIKNRLEDIILALGLDSGNSSDDSKVKAETGEAAKMKILEDLDKGLISIEEATELLNN